MKHTLESIPNLLTKLNKEFPFPDYFYLGFGTHTTLVKTVRKWVPHGGKVLDIGCGPLDKTALLAWDGYACMAVDDLADGWHRKGDNLQKIKSFAKNAKIDFTISEGDALPPKAKNLDAVLLLDIIEHLHASPKTLLQAALDRLKPGGVIIITVPSAVNIRKRINVLLGRTNYPPYQQFFEAPVWRGHVREYTRNDLYQLATLMHLPIQELRGIDQMLGVLPSVLHKPYLFVTNLFPNLKDSLLLVVRKP